MRMVLLAERRWVPVSRVHWCATPGDARTEDSSIGLAVASYDPDLSPTTGILVTDKYHAVCKPSAISWVQPVDVPCGPRHIELPASATPRTRGEFALTATPLVGDEPTAPAVLVLTAEVVDDAGQGTVPWLNEFQFWLNASGFAPPESLTTETTSDWSLRIVTDYPSCLAPRWIVLRTGSAGHSTTPPHLFLGALDLSENWVERARRRGQVVVVVGPFPHGADVSRLPDQLDVDALEELIEDGTLITGWVRVTADDE